MVFFDAERRRNARRRRQLPRWKRAKAYSIDAVWRTGIFGAAAFAALMADRAWPGLLRADVAAQAATTPPSSEELTVAPAAAPPSAPTTLAESFARRQTRYNVSLYRDKRKMNFPMRSEFEINDSHVEWYETAEEPQGMSLVAGSKMPDAEPPLISKNGEFFERRWSFKDTKVDMILRFPVDYDAKYCTSIILFPAENAWPAEMRGFLYLTFLFYLFLGVAIISDVFMSGIERITAEREREVPDGVDDDGNPKFKTETYAVWNDTVANLTLLALGSSAPEILLSLLETMLGFGGPPGELGPSTIVGSAAFNLLVITAVCMAALEELKKVEQLGVFIITSISSIFAYVWMIIVLQLWTPDVVTIYEAVLTFLFFPLLVGLAYGQSINWGRKEPEPAAPVNVEAGQLSPGALSPSQNMTGAQRDVVIHDAVGEKIRAAKQGGQEPTAASIAASVAKQTRPRLNHGHYRINALRGLMAKKQVIKSIVGSQETTAKVTPEDNSQWAGKPGVAEFTSPTYSVLESEGPIVLKVQRRYGTTGRLEVRFSTQDLTAIDKTHYQSKTATLVWQDGDSSEKPIPVPIIDNDEHNDDMTFMARIEPTEHGSVGAIKLCTVRIIDDDDPGELTVESETVEVTESAGNARIRILRQKGVTGTVKVTYETEDGFGNEAATCQGPTPDYEERKGELVFKGGEHTKTIDIPIFDDFEYDKTEHFFLRLTGIEGKGARLGKCRKCRIQITHSPEMQKLYENAQAQAQKEADISGQLATSTWMEQIRTAMTVDSEEGEDPECLSLIMHFLTFMWKVLFSLVPPTEYGGGWACFFVSLGWIALMVWVIAEVAMMFGCVVGLEDSVTAITFLALGTSLPDTFASKTAVMDQPTADAAVGNVTGSNSVNVYLGLGLPWLLASIYYEGGLESGEDKVGCYLVPAGALSFSVMVFTLCALVCLGMLFVLRATRGYELGGSPPFRKGAAACLCFLWMLYIVLSCLHGRQSPVTGARVEGAFWFNDPTKCPTYSSCQPRGLYKMLPHACCQHGPPCSCPGTCGHVIGQ